MIEAAKDKIDLSAIGEDIAALKRDFAAFLEHTKRTASAAGSGAAQQLGGEAERLYRTAVDEGQRQIATVARQVEEQPLRSALIAFAVGFIAGRLLSR